MSNLLSKLAQAESLRSSKFNREQAQLKADQASQIRELSGSAMGGNKESLSKLAALDPKRGLDVQQFVSNASEEQIKTAGRTAQRIAQLASISNTPEEWKVNLQRGALEGWIPEEMKTRYENDFGSKQYVMAKADEYKTMLERAFKEKESTRSMIHAERMAEKKAKGKYKVQTPTKEDIESATSILNRSFPDMNPSNAADYAFASDIKKNMYDKGMTYGDAVRASLETFRRDLQDVEEPVDKPGWGTGDYTQDYLPSDQPMSMGKMEFMPVDMPGGSQLMVEGGVLKPGVRVKDPRTGRMGTYR